MSKGSLGEAVLDLAADGAGLVKDINKSQPAALGALQKLGVAGGALLAVGIAAAATAVVGITKLIWDAGQTMDAAYDTLAVKTGKTGEDLQVLQKDFDEVFKSVPTDAATASEVVGTLNSRLGATGDTLQDMSKNVLEFSRLTGTDAATNADTFGQMVGNWEIPLEDASGSLDMLMVASQKTGVPVDQLMQQMTDSGPILRQYGFGFKESAAFLASTSQAGLDSTAVMMGLKSAAAKYAAEGKPLNEGLAESYELIKNAEDPTVALNKAVEIFGGRAGPLMVDAIRSGKMEFTDLIPALEDADGAIMDTAESTMDWGERWQLFQQRMTVALGPAGQGLMGAVSTALAAVEDAFNRPEVQAAIMTLVDGIVSFAQALATHLPAIIDGAFKFIGMIQSFLQANPGVLVAILAAIGAALIAFGVSAAIAGITAMAGLWPVILVIVLIAAAAYLLYQAWTTNFGGIRDIVASVWAKLQPIFQMIKTWLEVNIPIAIAALTAYWQNVLLPAIMMVWAWIQANLMPLLAALGHFLGAVIGLAVKLLAAYWQNVLLPAMKKFGDFVNDKIMPIIKTLADWLNTKLKPAWEGIAKVLKTVTDWFNKIADAIEGIEIPDNLTPGSPTPFETGLWGIHKALKALATASLPTLAAEMQVSASGQYGMAAMRGMAFEDGVPGQGATKIEFYAPVTIQPKDNRTIADTVKELRG